MSTADLVRPESDAEIVQRILSGSETSLVEKMAGRPLRTMLLREVTQVQSRDGRFIGLISPSDPVESECVSGAVSHFHQNSLAFRIGFAAVFEPLIGQHSRPECPECRVPGAAFSTFSAHTSADAGLQGVLLVTIALDDRAGATPLEQMDFWGAERLTDGDQVWTRELVESWQQLPARTLFAVLDSAQIPLSAASEMRLQTLSARLRALSSSFLRLFLRKTAHASLIDLGERMLGWHCDTCRRMIPVSDQTPRWLGGVPVARLLQSTAVQFDELRVMAQISSASVDRSLVLFRQAGLDRIPLNTPVSSLSLPDRSILKAAAVVQADISDMLLLIDEVPELLPPTRREQMDILLDAIRRKNNHCVTLSAAECDLLIEGKNSRSEVNPIEIGGAPFSLMLPRRGIGVLTGDSVLDSFPLIVQAVERLKDQGQLPWKSVESLTVAELRREQDVSLLSVCGLYDVLLSLVKEALATGTAALPLRLIRTLLCRRCLGMGETGEQEPCDCGISDAHRESLGNLMLKGRSYRSWVHASLAEIQPLFRGFARCSALIDALLELGAGRYQAVSSCNTLSDLERQQYRALTLVAGTGSDLYLRNRSRRQAGDRLFLFSYLFLGLPAEQKLAFEYQLRQLVLPDDTIGYLDSRPRFKNHYQHGMVDC